MSRLSKYTIPPRGRIGRPAFLTDEIKKDIEAAILIGLNNTQIAGMLKVSRRTIQRYAPAIRAELSAEESV